MCSRLPRGAGDGGTSIICLHEQKAGKMKTLNIGLATVVAASVVGCKTIIVNSVAGANATTDDGRQTVPAQIETHWFNDIFSGGKKVIVSKTGYASKTVALKTSMPESINVALDRKFNITANQDGAVVYVNGVAKGKTPLKGIALNDSGDTIVSVKKKGWLEAKIKPTAETPTDINLIMDQDGSGRKLLNLVSNQNGVTIKSTPIFSDTDVGEDSPNVAQVRRLTSQPQNEFIESMSLLPDGKSIVASILEETEKDGKFEYRANLWILDSSIAGAPRRAATSGNYFDITANASVDGKTLYFSSTRNGRLAIWSLNMKTMAGLKLLTNANTADYSPAIDPHGKDLLYTALLPGGSNPAYLWSKPANGGGMPSQLREGFNAVWSPDGKKCLYVKGDAEKNEANIWVMDANGGNPTQLSMGGSKANDIDPQWSPDGKKIVFASNRGTIKGRKNYDIWMMNADGSDLTQLTTNGSCDDKPVFAPDGKTIFFRSNRGLVWDIWVMQLENGK